MRNVEVYCHGIPIGQGGLKRRERRYRLTIVRSIAQSQFRAAQAKPKDNSGDPCLNAPLSAFWRLPLLHRIGHVGLRASAPTPMAAMGASVATGAAIRTADRVRTPAASTCIIMSRRRMAERRDRPRPAATGDAQLERGKIDRGHGPGRRRGRDPSRSPIRASGSATRHRRGGSRATATTSWRQLVRDRPRRFGLFAAMPLPDVDGTLARDRLCARHAEGRRHRPVHQLPRYLARQRAFKPVMEELNRRKALVFVHPTAAACCLNLIPDVAPGHDRVRHRHHARHSRHAVQRHAVRFPDIRFIWSHAGGTAPFFAGRIEAKSPRAQGSRDAAAARRDPRDEEVLLRRRRRRQPRRTGVADETGRRFRRFCSAPITRAG